MIRFTNHSKEAMVGLQKASNAYTFLHWDDHLSITSKYKWLKHSLTLKEYKGIGPTMLVEWQDD